MLIGENNSTNREDATMMSAFVKSGTSSILEGSAFSNYELRSILKRTNSIPKKLSVTFHEGTRSPARENLPVRPNLDILYG